jgi:nucleoside-diphosphate-sugar epimerase
MKKVLITGSGGVIGTVLRTKLPHELTEFDLPHADVNNFEHVLQKAKGHDTVVHLAWAKTHDDWLSENLNPANVQSAFNVYEAAHQAGVKRVIMASSVHADKFAGRDVNVPLRPYDLPTPDSPYGASKCMVEALGRYYADAKGIEVICVRFGGINKHDTPPHTPYSERQVWLSQNDCVNLLSFLITAPEVPGKYAIVYAVSNNKDMLHDISNDFGWVPQDGAV